MLIVRPPSNFMAVHVPLHMDMQSIVKIKGGGKTKYQGTMYEGRPSNYAKNT